MSTIPFPRGGGDHASGAADGKKDKKKPAAATNDEVRTAYCIYSDMDADVQLIVSCLWIAGQLVRLKTHPYCI